MVYDPSYSFERMSGVVERAVRKANDTPARKHFLERLKYECTDKYDIETICFNAINKGRKYQC
jgi:hypothetical protein